VKIGKIKEEMRYYGEKEHSRLDIIIFEVKNRENVKVYFWFQNLKWSIFDENKVQGMSILYL
jgi:hypothetical protein